MQEQTINTHTTLRQKIPQILQVPSIKGSQSRNKYKGVCGWMTVNTGADIATHISEQKGNSSQRKTAAVDTSLNTCRKPREQNVSKS